MTAYNGNAEVKGVFARPDDVACSVLFACVYTRTGTFKKPKSQNTSNEDYLNIALRP